MLKASQIDNVNDEVYYWHTDKRWSLLQVDTYNFGCVYPGMPKVPKITLQYIQKSTWDEVDFLPADKYESFLQVNGINLGVHSQACPKYPK